MQVEEGVWYLTRDGRRAEVKNRNCISDVLIDGKKISTVFTDCGTNRRDDPCDYWDIVGLWEDKNPDGTYKLPDEKVSLVWQRDDGAIVHKRLATDDSWHGPYFVGCKGPPVGHWLPWTPPVFPVRKKTELRLAKVRIGNHEYTAVTSQKKAGYPWTVVWNDDCWVCRRDNEVTVLEWLTPEYEDELEAKQA